MIKLIKTLAAVAPGSRALACPGSSTKPGNFTMRTPLGSEATGAVAPSQTRRIIMSRLYSPIGRRHRVATSALVGAIGIFLSAAAAPAETTYSAASGSRPLRKRP